MLTQIKVALVGGVAAAGEGFGGRVCVVFCPTIFCQLIGRFVPVLPKQQLQISRALCLRFAYVEVCVMLALPVCVNVASALYSVSVPALACVLTTVQMFLNHSEQSSQLSLKALSTSCM